MIFPILISASRSSVEFSDFGQNFLNYIAIQRVEILISFRHPYYPSAKWEKPT
jgi:hypothetical protein